MFFSSKGNIKQRLGFYLGLVLAVCALWLPLPDAPLLANRMAAVAILMAIWWVTEALPIPVTALVPLVAFPIFGILSGERTASQYFNQYSFLFIGGFMIALSIEKWNLHKRIALAIISFVGFKLRQIVLGFMISSAFLSMWISNTATTMMMVPIGLSIISLFKSSSTIKKGELDCSAYFSPALMLAIAYGASIGGIATLVGTPPNLSFARIYKIQFPQAPAITFGDWFIMAFPLSVLFLILTWILLVYFIFPLKSATKGHFQEVIAKERANLQKLSAPEKRVGAIFLIVALLWIFRKDLNLFSLTIPGWTSLLDSFLNTIGIKDLKLTNLIDDGTIAIFGAILLFIVPSGRESGEKLADWDMAKNLPWGILLLFGGGFALAKGFAVTGLSLWIGKQLAFLANLSLLGLTMAVSATVIFLTELTSNTATTEMILPVVAGLAQHLAINPLALMVPVTISASFAFMLPVATPPNAIVFASGYISIKDMIKAGFILNLAGILIISLFSIFWFS